MKSESEILIKMSELDEEMKELENLSMELGEEGRGSHDARAIVRELNKNRIFHSALQWVLNVELRPKAIQP